MLQREIHHVLDQLISPLTDRIVELLSTPVSGTDDTLTHTEAKKGYVTFLNNIMLNKLGDIFLSESLSNPLQMSTFLTLSDRKQRKASKYSPKRRACSAGQYGSVFTKNGSDILFTLHKRVGSTQPVGSVSEW